MKFSIRNQPDFFAGLLFVGLGLAFAILAARYRAGTAAQMGPGFFPLMLGVILTLLGVVVSLRSLTRLDAVERIEPISWRPLVSVLGALLLFALLIMPVGFIVASAVLVLLSASASHEFGLRYAVLTTVILIAACYAIFVYGLGLPMPIWPGGL